MTVTIGRRELLAALGGAAAVWPLAARAQPKRMRRIGVLANLAEDDPEDRKRVEAFLQALQKLGWREGDNLQIDYRHALGKLATARKFAAELVARGPDVILATGSLVTGALLDVTRTVPIVFLIVPDPVGAGFVESLARPGGNATGFSQFEYATTGKWVELLIDFAPRLTNIGVLRDVAIAAGPAQFGVIQAAAASYQIELLPIGVRDAAEIEQGITAFARETNGGLIVTGNPSSIIYRDLIVTLAAKHKLPTVYYARSFVAGGGLISYGPDLVDQYRRAAGYIDRILKGEKPADLPVQAPTKYDLVINLKTAKALGLDVPPTLLGRADEVIE